MESSEGLLSFMDLLDLDEDLIDARLKTIMERKDHFNKHLSNALQLLQYKNLINAHDKTDCENIKEFDFVVKLIKGIRPDIIENVCRITKLVLSLDLNKLVSNSQHLIQQVLANIDLSHEIPKAADCESEQSITLLYLKICDCVLETVIENGLKIELYFMDMPLEKTICHSDDKVKIHFITNTIPKIFIGVEGYNILDKVWAYVQELKEIELALKVVSCLSDYYLPVVDAKGKVNFDSKVVYHSDLWRLVLSGLISVDYTCRKMSLYLAKRALDYMTSKHRSINIISEKDIILSWDPKRYNELRKTWENFFILIDSLEEKQSNIVLPSLQLFDSLNELNFCWLNCAFNLGLKHDNSQVRLKCVQYRLKRKIHSVIEATVLLQALDDINFYEIVHDTKLIKDNLKGAINDDNIKNILKALPLANLTPVPLFHVTDVLTQANLHVVFDCDETAVKILSEIIKISCNNIPLRKAFHMNVAHFIAYSCQGLSWKVLAKLFALQLELSEIEAPENPIITTLNKKLDQENSKELYEYGTNTLLDVDYGLFYVDKNVKGIDLYIEIIYKKLQNLADIVKRQYSNKLNCFQDAIIILKIFRECKVNNSEARGIIKNVITNEFKTILHYIFCLLTNDTACSVDESKALFSYMTWPEEILGISEEIVLQLYKSSVILLSDANVQLEYTALSIYIVNSLSNNMMFCKNFKHEMLDIKSLINLTKIFEKIEFTKAKSVGRLKNTFYEKHSETVSTLLEDGNEIDLYLVDIVEYIDKITECGGYGCLFWILKIMNKVVKYITLNDHIKFDVNEFIHRMWREIEELKTNNLNYSPCMEEFAQLITQEALLHKPTYNNTVLLYCNKIIEYGVIKNNPLYYLTRELKGTEIKQYGHLVLILGELLFYCPVSRKDHRITDNLTIEILGKKKFGINKKSLDQHFTFEIQYAAIEMFSRIQDIETLDVLLRFITNKIDDIFKHKVRYHGNSQIHRTIQTGLQHIVLLLLHYPQAASRILDWSIPLLGKLPHQQSVRICLEWSIALSFYMQGLQTDSNVLNLLKSKNVPIPSQFIIMYWLIKHKLKNGTLSNEEYEFVMENLLSNTMGQLFNIRLHAQYLSTKLHALNKNSNGKYDYTIQVINRTLNENANDKNFVKLKGDYFVNEFDIVSNLTPLFLYNVMPRLCDSNNGEVVKVDFVIESITKINKNICQKFYNKVFMEEWSQCRTKDEVFINNEFIKQVSSKVVEEQEITATLQKKYIPWNNMSDVNAYESTKKRETSSDLIVVASLIDKLPNLGGMARTSEVFGVKTYVIDSLRHLQDKQFQGLSVSAERWINVEEVRPGQPLKDYLNQKKAEGYAVVAAEQTSTGSNLQSFKFPKKTLLLLGHEKEGIPCNLLPMMDHCVEIPQQGFVRSLNVHVTAAIFVWEYARQNLL